MVIRCTVSGAEPRVESESPIAPRLENAARFYHFSLCTAITCGTKNKEDEYALSDLFTEDRDIVAMLKAQLPRVSGTRLDHRVGKFVPRRDCTER